MYSIALYPGDGIGIEVLNEAVSVLKAVEEVRGQKLFDFTQFDWGSVLWKRTGRLVPENYLDKLRDFDVVFLGALGDPANVPDHISLVPLIEMRQSFDQYVCLRPAKLLPGVRCPLAGKECGDIDILVIRENSEGEYADVGGGLKVGREDEISIQTAVHTRHGIERIIRYAFTAAGLRRHKLTVATKSNALKYGMVLWDATFEDVRKDYPHIKADKCHVDALAMNLVRWPERYDVVVASNLFGDILSDLGGVISGSLGMAPSANINPERRYPSLFEPVHGSAPDIAGKGVANPIAAIRSGAMMLEFLGLQEEATLVENAVKGCLVDGRALTPDIGGTATTSIVGADIRSRILAQ